MNMDGSSPVWTLSWAFRFCGCKLSHVSSKYLDEYISCHKTYKNMAFHLCEMSHEPSKYLIVWISCHKTYMNMAFYLCESSHDASNYVHILSQQLHEYVFSPLWIISCFFKVLECVNFLSCMNMAFYLCESSHESLKHFLSYTFCHKTCINIAFYLCESSHGPSKHLIL